MRVNWRRCVHVSTDSTPLDRTCHGPVTRPNGYGKVTGTGTGHEIFTRDLPVPVWAGDGSVTGSVQGVDTCTHLCQFTRIIFDCSHDNATTTSTPTHSHFVLFHRVSVTCHIATSSPTMTTTSNHHPSSHINTAAQKGRGALGA